MVRDVMLRFSFLAAFAAVSTSIVAGCAADTSAEDAEANDENTDEADLTAAGKALVGAYVDDSGTFKGLVLTNDKVGQAAKFFADVDTGIRCITTPCPSAARIEGTFTAGTKTITLRSANPPAHVQHILGQYKYLKQGDKLTLTKSGKSQSLSKEISYCAEATDCYAQALIVPACMGQFACTGTNTCSFSCVQWPPPPMSPCKGKDLAQCQASSMCQPKWGPSHCSPDGRICTKDIVFKSCEDKPAPQPTKTKCFSSGSCAADEYCTTEDGVCNSSGMLAVCSGFCEKGDRN